MNQDSWVVLHDISLPLMSLRENDLACRYLFSNVVSEEKLMPAPDFDSYFANIGAFKITSDTRKYIGNLFQSLVLAWDAMPLMSDYRFRSYATPILDEDLKNVEAIISKYYPEHYEFFENAVRIQSVILQHKIAQNTGWKAFIKRNFPYMTRPLRAIHKKIYSLLNF